VQIDLRVECRAEDIGSPRKVNRIRAGRKEIAVAFDAGIDDLVQPDPILRGQHDVTRLGHVQGHGQTGVCGG
jgi:hypothetical protein